jgi:hypothetical protein
VSRPVLGDRYRLGERIADGGMGSVYRAVDENLGRPVAVKVPRRELVDEPAFLERFRRPDVPDPRPPAAWAPEREGSPAGRRVRGAVHSPQEPHPRTARPGRPAARRRGWRWGRSS